MLQPSASGRTGSARTLSWWVAGLPCFGFPLASPVVLDQSSWRALPCWLRRLTAPCCPAFAQEAQSKGLAQEAAGFQAARRDWGQRKLQLEQELQQLAEAKGELAAGVRVPHSRLAAMPRLACPCVPVC